MSNTNIIALKKLEIISIADFVRNFNMIFSHYYYQVLLCISINKNIKPNELSEIIEYIGKHFALFRYPIF